MAVGRSHSALNGIFVSAPPWLANVKIYKVSEGRSQGSGVELCVRGEVEEVAGI